jgi:dTDP-4-dehydrorhamnose 3,5-epimerase
MSQQMPQEKLAFHDGPIDGVTFHPLAPYKDHRGWLIELYREDELPPEQHPVMAYVSETLPGVARGPHEHVDQTDYFAFLGPGEFRLYLWDARPASPTRGCCMKVAVGESNRQSVVVPPGVVHAYKNIGQTPGWVFNAPNRLYAGAGKREPVDEIRHEDARSSAYRLD